MAMVDVDSQPKSVGLVWGLASFLNWPTDPWDKGRHTSCWLSDVTTVGIRLC